MAKWHSVLLGLAIVLGAFVARSLLCFVSLWFYIAKVYLPQHPPPPGVGEVSGGCLPSLLVGLCAGLVAGGILLRRKQRL